MDWKKAAEQYKEQMISDLSTLVSINSARDTDHKTEDYPLGPGPADALQKMLEIGQRDGFITKNVDNYGGHIEYGQGKQIIGILGHMDTVPAGEGWKTDPFQLTEDNGRLYGRGALDDKGPSLAAYYALRILKDNNFQINPNKKIRMIYGTDEESNWEGIKHYLKFEPTPKTGFSPDAEFPLINGEKGIVSYSLQFPKDDQINDVVLKSFEAGLRPNMVPQKAIAIILTDEIEEWNNSFETYLTNHPNIKGNLTIADHSISIEIIGKVAHAMEPQNGINAATYLADYLNTQKLDPTAKTYVNFISKYLHKDPWAKNSNIGYKDNIMGSLTQSADIFNYYAKGAGSIIVNVRYPKGKDANQILRMYQELSPDMKVSIADSAQAPHFVNPDSMLVKELLGAYRDMTGDNSPAESVGGGTYARMLPKGVAFGAMMPGNENVMHQPNEYISIDNLVEATAIYADAIARIAK